ncbi:MAG: hypothetical protein DMG51_13470 [Acidobacteria bacterium]|nr:MAG: hypothetical protein DMG51_13470 [Acidobacteriota bacterium]
MGLLILLSKGEGGASGEGHRSCEPRVLVVSSKRRSGRETKWINSSRCRVRCRSKRTMNFVYIFPNGAQGKLLNSMILSPGHAKRIWRALGENLARYETQFGTIKESPEGSTPAPNVGFVQ